jgi:hypothetical protein
MDKFTPGFYLHWGEHLAYRNFHPMALMVMLVAPGMPEIVPYRAVKSFFMMALAAVIVFTLTSLGASVMMKAIAVRDLPIQGCLAMNGKYTRRSVGITLTVPFKSGGSVVSVTVYQV